MAASKTTIPTAGARPTGRASRRASAGGRGVVPRTILAWALSPILFIAPRSIAFDDPPAAPEYRRDVAPILRAYCVGCHNAEDANSGLAMHTFSSLSKGGENGPAFVPSKSGESRLYLMVTGELEPHMPPEDNPAPNPEEIEVLRRWIDAGAPPPADPDELMVADPATPDVPPKSPPQPRVHSVAWAPDGKLVALGGFERVALVDPNTNYVERVLVGLGGNVASAAFTPDGKRVLAAGGRPGVDGKAVLWNAADGTVEREFAGHSDSLYAAVLSGDQSTLATAGYDKRILLWNAADGRILRELKGHNDAVYGLAFRPGDNVLASASGDRTVKLWDRESGERLDTFSQALKELFAVAATPDGSLILAGGADNRIRAWRLGEAAREGTNTLVQSRFAHDGEILALAVSPDGATLASAASNRSVKLWRLPELAESAVLGEQSDWPSALAFDPSGTKLLVGRLDGTASLYEVSSGRLIKEVVPTEKPPPPPTLARKLPIGVRRGGMVRLELEGEHLARTTGVEVSHPGLTAAVAAAPPPADPRIVVELTAAEDAPLGRHELIVATPGGRTPPLAVWVDTVDQCEEQALSEGPLALPGAVWGALGKPGEVDEVRIVVAAGQTLLLDAAAKGVGSKADLVLTLVGPDGRVAASTLKTEGSDDPFLVWSAPADGTYVVRVHDLAYAGSPEHIYRLTVGALPFVLGVHPLVVPTGRETAVELVGVNLPADAVVRVSPERPGEVPLPLDAAAYRWHRTPKVVAAELVAAEIEPNDAPDQATAMAAPGEASGRLYSPDGGQDVDHYRFSAKAGQELIFETESARRGLPVDTRLDVLTADGEPIDRVWLAAVRDSYVEFRGFDSQQLEIRCKNWEEMELNEFMYLNGEVAKLFRHPRGPDSGFQFYSVRGRRATYFDTTGTTHAVEDPVYIVEPHPPGGRFESTGLPVFKLTYMNDDASGGELGTDSRLTFRAPADGEYLVRVVDTRGASGAHHAYRLSARTPKPDFRVRLSNRTPTVNRGGGREVVFSVDRIDGFEGEVEIEVGELPAGLSLSRPIRIEAGHESASAVLLAAADAAAPSEEQLKGVSWTARATIQGEAATRPVAGFEKIHLADAPKILVRLEPAEITIAPGSVVSAQLIVERRGHDDRVTFEMPGLPHGVIVDNIGLNGILIPEGQTQREVFLSARPWTPETDRPFFARANEAESQCSPPALLRVRRPSQVAQQSPAGNP